MNRIQKGCLFLCVLLLTQAGCYQLFRFDLAYRFLIDMKVTRILYGCLCFFCAFGCLSTMKK